MLIAPRLRLPLGLPSEAKLGKPSNLTMAALLMIALVFAWLFSQVDAAHLKTTQSNLTLAAVQAKATGTSEPSDGSDGPVHSPGQISLKAAGNNWGQSKINASET